MNFYKSIKQLTFLALVVAGFYFFFNGKLIYTVIIVITFSLFMFIIINKGNLLLATKQKFKNTKTYIKSLLFEGTPIKLLMVWYIFFAIINNFVIEPLTTFSKRIPYGAVSKIPDSYNGVWEREIQDYKDVFISKLTIKNEKMTYDSMEKGHEETKQKVRCELPEIYYNFENLEEKYSYKFWYIFVDILVLPLVPETIFGSQYIYWSCDYSINNTLSYLSLSEPSAEYFDVSYGEIGVVLHDPYYVGYGEMTYTPKNGHSFINSLFHTHQAIYNPKLNEGV